MENSNVSNSKAKRLERQKKNEAAKRQSIITNVVIAVVALVVVAAIAYGIYGIVQKAANTLTPNSNYSVAVDDNGFIKGVKATDYIDVCDYKNIKVPLSEVEYSDESVDADIETALDSHKVLVSEDVEVKDGDTVSIDYVGTIDGVEFEGGNSNDQGHDLTIGSGSFIDDFEQQLIGYKPGDVVTVDVTFPEDYSSADLAGKDAQFVVTIHGVYVKPEFDDDFVCAYYADYATTAEGYRQYLKDSHYETKLTEYVANYIVENSSLIKYPKKFLKSVEETSMYSDQESYEYMNELYVQYNGQGISSFEEYVGMSMEEYEAQLVESCEQTVKADLVYQAILEKEGVKASVDELKEMVATNYGEGEESYNTLIENYGQGYMMLSVNEQKAVEIAKGYATVE